MIKNEDYYLEIEFFFKVQRLVAMRPDFPIVKKISIQYSKIIENFVLHVNFSFQQL